MQLRIVIRAVPGGLTSEKRRLCRLRSGETALEVTSKVIQVVGGRGAYRDFPAERALRDVRTSTLMPPTPDRMLEAIGKSALGLDIPMFTAKT
jgi:alkylation response protein AidB-like acyl-CoA dehydrogenase